MIPHHCFASAHDLSPVLHIIWICTMHTEVCVQIHMICIVIPILGRHLVAPKASQTVMQKGCYHVCHAHTLQAELLVEVVSSVWPCTVNFCKTVFNADMQTCHVCIENMLVMGEIFTFDDLLHMPPKREG